MGRSGGDQLRLLLPKRKLDKPIVLCRSLQVGSWVR